MSIWNQPSKLSKAGYIKYSYNRTSFNTHQDNTLLSKNCYPTAMLNKCYKSMSEQLINFFNLVSLKTMHYKIVHVMSNPYFTVQIT